jgi:DNA invertase Pin-like site-specific DNA recombinase
LQTLQQEPQRAAILVHARNIAGISIEEQQEACRRYCQQHGYQISEQRVYENGGKPFGSNAPQLVQLRMLVVQDQLDVLVIPWSGCLGALPLWWSLSVATTIDEFYKRGVCIESVTKRHGCHDIYQQMLLDALHFVERFGAGKMPHSHFYRGDDHGEKQI